MRLVAAPIAFIRRNCVPMLAMTAKADSRLTQHADVVIYTHVDREACPLWLAPTASKMLTLALGYALVMSMLLARGDAVARYAGP